MAHHTSSTSTSSTNSSFAASLASTSGGIFSRRPSLFGSKSKPTSNHKHQRSTSSDYRTLIAPQLNLPPVTTTLDLGDSSLFASTNQYDPPAKVPQTPPRRRHQSRHSIASSVAEIGAQLRRSHSTSFRPDPTARAATTASPSSHKRTPSATLATYSPEKAPGPNASASSRPALSISTFSRAKSKSGENTRQDSYDKTPGSAVDKPKTPFGMSAIPIGWQPPTQKEILHANQQANRGLAPAAPIPGPNGSNPHIIFQQIHELASKRISTLDYLRKAHEGRIYWFNTLLFAKNDLTRLPSFTPRNASRRATHYLLLGFSLPTILDLNANSPTDYLKALNALLLEFEQYQTIHPTDGSAPSSLSRARLPQMFKRANLNMGGKGRRSSSAAGDFPMLTPSTSFNGETSFDSPPNEDLLLPNESYTHLQTPSLPFDPDFFSTFATLCDVLIDCYTKILSMLATPESVAIAGGGVPSTVGDLFNKADARVRKIILAGVVREFEESCRAGLKSEVGGVGKVVLGGLM